MINVAKFGIGLVSRTTDVISLAKDMEDGYRLIKNSTIVLKDTYDSLKSGKETGQSVKEALDVTK